MKISLEKLHRKAASRPPGYLEEVLAAGTVKDSFVHLTPIAYNNLLAKYDPQALDKSPSPPRSGRGVRGEVSLLPPRKLSGLGDAVALIAQPIARAIDRVAKTDLQNCQKCKQRQAKLNAAIPF